MSLLYAFRDWLARAFSDYPPCIDLKRVLLEEQRKGRK